MRDGSLNVSVGARLWYLGSAWTVVELDGALVTLRSSAHLKKVHGSSLVGSATSLDDNSDVGDSGELEAVALSALNPGKRSEVERQAQVFDEIVMAPSSMSAKRTVPSRCGRTWNFPPNCVSKGSAIRRKRDCWACGFASTATEPANS